MLNHDKWPVYLKTWLSYIVFEEKLCGNFVRYIKYFIFGKNSDIELGVLWKYITFYIIYHMHLPSCMFLLNVEISKLIREQMWEEYILIDAIDGTDLCFKYHVTNQFETNDLSFFHTRNNVSRHVLANCHLLSSLFFNLVYEGFHCKGH